MDMKNIFDGLDPEAHADEVTQRWGDTDAYRTSARRTKAYRAEDWARMRDEQHAIYAEAAAALRAGTRPDDPVAMDVAEKHRLSIDRWFYPCSAQMHCALADMWRADPRFAASIDQHGTGLTAFLAAAVRANAERDRA